MMMSVVVPTWAAAVLVSSARRKSSRGRTPTFGTRRNADETAARLEMVSVLEAMVSHYAVGPTVVNSWRRVSGVETGDTARRGR